MNKKDSNTNHLPKNSAILASAAQPKKLPTSYPKIFAQVMIGREKRPLGDLFGLKNFGVNFTTLAPGARSSLFHKHLRQDEFIFILEGTPTLITESGEENLSSGMCAGFPAGGEAHQLVNRSNGPVVYLEVGDRSEDDEAIYPRDDLAGRFGTDGKWKYTRKNGEDLG